MTTLFTAGLAVAAMVAVVFQVHQIRRYGLSGVSALTWGLNLSVNLGWAAHLAVRGWWVAVAIDLVFALLALAVFTRTRPSPTVLLWTTAASVVLVASQFAVPLVGTLAVVAGTMFMSLPQAVTVVRGALAGGSVAGVSVASWSIYAAISILWLLWGAASGTPSTVWANGPAALWCVVIVATVRIFRRPLSTSGPGAAPASQAHIQAAAIAASPHEASDQTFIDAVSSEDG